MVKVQDDVLDRGTPPLTLFNLLLDKCSFNFGKKKYSLAHREVIRRKRPGILSDGVILLHDNTILIAKLKNCCQSSSGKSRATPYSPDSASNLDSKQGNLVSGARFSSESDAKTVVENWLNGQEYAS
ncbi:hypothetical protein AVEN_116765-1 [Araneus ventricosus]|uniref:Uncharacterized protein n=1 Tax=Araneus ventricosus TaxID=182803 RepID=A0A4Y2D7U7_ARAVE|nr:hypothetical protein AVEN_116765-1 [Araneus ventricosus]